VEIEMSDIRNFFVSRYGSRGKLLEADYGQLEVVALAFLSRDKQLMEDIRNKVDMHSINAANLYNIPIKEFLERKDKGEPHILKCRKLAKTMSFQLQYGAGPKSMAEQNGISLELAKRFIETYYHRYPRVKTYQDDVALQVSSSRKTTKKHTSNGFPMGLGLYPSITGRNYAFFEYDNPYHDGGKAWTSPTNFSPTQLKNYPVQGFATGDIVPMMLGKLFRAFAGLEDIKLINTVHDSILFDVREEHVFTYAKRIKEIMEDAPRFFEEEFGIEFDLKLEVEISCGSNWGWMEKIA
jgi:DNA polymerase I-like protein with 3'-5' exonuclease and polymerase domains